MGTLSGFAPWIAFWILVGNVPTAVAASVALLLAVVSLVAGRLGGTPGQSLAVAATGTFALATVFAVTASASFLDRWLLPLGFLGSLVAGLVCLLAEKPFVPEFAATGPPTDVTRSEPFGPMVRQVTSIWVGAFAAMTVSSVIPPIMLGEGAIDDSPSGAAIAFSWVIPIVLLGAAAAVARTLHQRAVAEAASPGTVRRTSFVAFRELAIDELYYLAREKAEREVGAGMEAYDVNIGSAGIPLTGDESRESWPATYKVRERR